MTRSRLRFAIAVLWLGLAAPAASQAATVSGTWSQVPGPPAGPSKRYGAALAFDDGLGFAWVVGGFDGTAVRNDVWIRALSLSDQWSSIPVAGPAPAPRLDATLVFDPARDQVILFGGATGAGLANDTWAIDLTGAPKWVPLATAGTPPSARYTHDAVFDAAHDRMLVFGGQDAVGACNDLWALDFSTAPPTWTALAPAGALPAARSGHSLVLDPLADRIVLFGGTGSVAGEVAHPLQDVWTLNLTGPPTWTPKTPSGGPPEARRSQRAVYDPTRHRLVVIAGSGAGAFLSDTWALDLDGGMSWTELSPGGGVLTPRAEMVATYDPSHDRVVVFGGRNGFTPLGDDVSLALADPATWFGTPGARLSHRVVYDPVARSMILFGGIAGATSFHDLLQLRLGAAPVWSEIDAGGAPPPARNEHVQVFDAANRRVIVFGGIDSPTFFNDTWQLSMAPTPTWSQLFPGGALPAAREGAAAAYDPVGQQMVVFGGVTSAGTSLHDLLALALTGAPAWSPLPNGASGPGPRYGSSMVYDSKRQRLLVFGGTTNEFSFDADVWSYDLAGTHTWSQLAPGAAGPTGRYGHEAIYDPVHDRMVMFGGYDGTFRNDAWELGFAGGSPRWAPLTPAGTPPSVRDFTSGAFDPVDDRFVLFGGNSPVPGPLAVPVADTWILRFGDVPVPVRVSLIGASVDAGAAKLTWYTPDGAGVAATVERTSDGATWEARAAILSDASGQLAYEDAVAQGGRYGFRLAVGPARQRTDVTWLDIPTAGATLRAGLAGAWPNPSRGAPTLSFTLAGGAGAATLDVFDVAGRRVYTRDVAPLGPGVHALDLRGAFPARAGVYLATLRIAGTTTTRKFAILP